MATCADTMRAGDRVLLQMKGKDAFMTKKLDPKATTTMQAGGVKHSEIIGKRSRDTVKSTKGYELRAYIPTLAQYVTLTPRLVTPVYPADANFIVSLLDINVDAYLPNSEEPPLELLEGGTGHGSLTLHLAKAVHAANPLLGEDLSLQNPNASEGVSIERLEKKRQAIVHTIDISDRHSKHAQQTVSGFRQGMYYDDVDFHVGDVSEWIENEFKSRGLKSKEEEEKAFLSHVILDMPDAHRHVEKAASALHVNGGLLLFNPSITQIMTVIKLVKEKYLPLQLDRVVELGPYMTGGKEWDVRSVKPRARVQAEEAARKAQAAVLEAQTGIEAASDGSGDPVETESSTTDLEEAEASTKLDEGWEMICRPKVGYMVTGGGFVGFFKKMKW